MNWQRSAARLLVVAVALMTVAGAFAPVGAAAADSQPQPPQRYFGTVSDDSGQGVGGLTVQVEDQNGDVVAEDVTDSDGYYDLQVNISEVDTDQQVSISVQEQTENADVESGGSTEVDFNVGDTIAGGSGEVDEDGNANVDLGDGNVGSVSVSDLPSEASTVTVYESRSPTGEASDPGRNVAVYLDIAADVDVSNDVGVTVTVDASAFDDAGFEASDAVLLHYTGGDWNDLETEVSEDDGEVTLEATANGLSPFAVAQADTEDGDGDTGGGDGDNGDNNGGNTGGTGGSGGGADTTTQQPTTDEPTTQQPTTEEPTTQQPTTEEPETTEEPSETTDEPATTEDPTTEEPVNEDDSPGVLLIGGILIVLVALAAAAFLVYRRE